MDDWFYYVLTGDRVRRVGPPMICRLCGHPDHRLRPCEFKIGEEVDPFQDFSSSPLATYRVCPCGVEDAGAELHRISDQC